MTETTMRCPCGGEVTIRYEGEWQDNYPYPGQTLWPDDIRWRPCDCGWEPTEREAQHAAVADCEAREEDRHNDCAGGGDGPDD